MCAEQDGGPDCLPRACPGAGEIKLTQKQSEGSAKLQNKKKKKKKGFREGGARGLLALGTSRQKE